MLTFDAAAHEYRWNGRLVPNVTRVLQPLTDLGRIPADALEIARQKGVAVHRMVDLDFLGDLDEDRLPEWMRPVLDTWRKFVAESGFRTVVSEHRVYHSTYGYAGTLDRYGELVHAGAFAFIDVKRSFLAGNVIGMQLIAYQRAYIDQEKDRNAKKALRYALRLNENAPYRLEPYTDEDQFQDFLACLTYLRVRGKYQ